MSEPKGVFDGLKWTPVIATEGKVKPIPPVEDGDGTVFISIPSYRDGERCGETLQSIFENAKDPDKVIIGLVEQNAPEDQWCLEEYCAKFGIDHTLKKRSIRKDTVKVFEEANLEKCPRRDQIRQVSFHYYAAKGPMFARSLARKVLGNEEFCMQIDAHTSFAKNWDEILKQEWKNTENEFGVITTVPPPKVEQDVYQPGGTKEKEVPRQCLITYNDNGIPDYKSPPEGLAVDLEKPLLSHGWSAAFSFAKCHFEESVPTDPFAPYAKPIEQFSRYARLWTRGYDTYTPTRNAVFHDFGNQANGHGNDEWFKRQKTRLRLMAITRVKTALQLKDGDESEAGQANLGLYGLGKRRSMKQLNEFANVPDPNKHKRKGNTSASRKCSGHEWVPYDTSVSSMEHMFSNPDNLDSQPEYPLRTKLTFYEQVKESTPTLDLDIAETTDRFAATGSHADGKRDLHSIESESSLPSATTLFVFWAFGLIVWCMLFKSPSENPATRPRRKTTTYKDV